jgi:hypothetical protein
LVELLVDDSKDEILNSNLRRKLFERPSIPKIKENITAPEKFAFKRLDMRDGQFCVSCGTKFNKAHVFCGHCGKKKVLWSKQR